MSPNPYFAPSIAQAIAAFVSASPPSFTTANPPQLGAHFWLVNIIPHGKHFERMSPNAHWLAVSPIFEIMSDLMDIKTAVFERVTYCLPIKATMHL